MADNAIQIDGLTKRYAKSKTALDSLTMSVTRGEIFGYLGPNGAGKTTTIRLLLDIIRPDSGHASIFGQDVHTHSVALHRRIGFLPGELSLWDKLTGQQTIDYLARVRGGVDMTYARTLIDTLAFDPTKPVRSYSTGNKRKLGLVLAMMHQPELLILDEPTNGLDPLMQQIFHNLMKEARDAGRTVFLSSHILSEVQQICERVAILRDGKLDAVQRVADLTHVNFRWVTLDLRVPLTAVQSADLAAIPGVSEIGTPAVNTNDRMSNSPNGTAASTQIRFRLTGDFDPIFRAVQDNYLIGVQIEEPNLEEIFLKYYNTSSSPINSMTQKQAVNS